MLIILRNPKIPLYPQHTGAARVDAPLGCLSHLYTPVQAEAVIVGITPGDGVNVEEVEGSVEAGFEVAQQDVDPQELRQVVGCLPPVTAALWWQLAVFMAGMQARCSASMKSASTLPK